MAPDQFALEVCEAFKGTDIEDRTRAGSDDDLPGADRAELSSVTAGPFKRDATSAGWDSRSRDVRRITHWVAGADKSSSTTTASGSGSSRCAGAH